MMGLELGRDIYIPGKELKCHHYITIIDNGLINGVSHSIGNNRIKSFTLTEEEYNSGELVRIVEFNDMELS